MLRGRNVFRSIVMMLLVMYAVIVAISSMEYKIYADTEDDVVYESTGDQGDDDFGQLDDIICERTSVSFSDIYSALSMGDMDGACRSIGKALADSFVYELRTSRVLALQIIAVIVLGSTFAQVSGNIGEYVMENGFMVTYMVLVSLLLGDFVVVQNVVIDTIGDVTEFMRAFYPMYASQILYVSGPESAVYSQSIIILVIYI